MAKRIFISYTKEDYEAVSVVVSDLKLRGFEVWFAPKDLRAGESIPEVVFDEIKSADCVIVMLSRSSINAPWVIDEMNKALALRNQGRSTVIIPAFLEPVEIPTALINFKGIDLKPQVGKSVLDNLVEAIEGRRPEEKSYPERFLEFIRSLIPVESDIDDALTSLASTVKLLKQLNNRRAETGTQDTQLVEIQRRFEESYTQQISHARRRLDGALEASRLSSADRERILAQVHKDQPPPVLLQSQINEAVSWARRADEELISLAAFLYSCRMHDMGLFLVGNFLRRWSSLRGQPIEYKEYDEEFEWRQSQLARRALDTRLLKESPSDDRGRHGVSQYFTGGPHFASAGRAAYLFALYGGEKFLHD